MKLKHLCFGAALLLIRFPDGGRLHAQTNEGSAFDQSKFVPDIAFILDVSALARNMRDEEYSSLAFPGFSFPFLDETGLTGSHARSMNFNYGELSLASAVDPYFDLFAVLDFGPQEAGVEEAYFSTRRLPYGLKLKAGKFLASFGRVNEQHEHFWDFANRPLIAEALFGEGGLNEIGAHVAWVAPASFYLEAGAEVLNGENGRAFGIRGFSDPEGRQLIRAARGPNVIGGYVRTSFDLGEAAILCGLSTETGTARRDDDGFSLSGSTGNAIDAATTIIGGDLTIKYSLDAIRAVSFQGEYMYRTMNGTEYAHDLTDRVASTSLKKHNSGLYAQVTAKLDQRWALGARYDLLVQNDVSLGGSDQHLPSDLPRYSAMLSYQPTEFSRLRLQFDRDESRFSGSRQPYTQLILQATMAIGAHGAHAF